MLRLLVSLVSVFAVVAHAQRPVPFELSVSPSRQMFAAAPGESVSRSLTLNNLGREKNEFNARTLDWTMTDSADVRYSDVLAVGSCRPWVSIERKRVVVEAGQQRVYRFQIDVPKDTPRRECRFMLAFEGTAPAATPTTKSAAGELRSSVVARIAVPVYISIGNAAPVLEMLGTTMVEINGTRTPALRIANRGDAHGRLDGAIDAVDANGQEFILAPEESPILPGQTRAIPLLPKVDRGPKVGAVKLPIRAPGSIEWEGGSLKVDARFE